MTTELRDWAKRQGYHVGWCAAAPLVDSIRAEIDARAAGGELDPDFHRQYLRPREHPPGATPAGTVVVVAVPRPAHRLVFETGSAAVSALIPPTYLNYRETARKVESELGPMLERPALLPGASLKALAARLGVVQYGRNNIAYVPGRGSYHQLVGVVTGDALPGGGEREPELMPACAGCEQCRRACPTGAIRPDRFLLQAHRCGTLANEVPGPWPSWLPSSFHHCLIGCLRCQEVCPENAGCLQEEIIEHSFEPETTASLLAGEVTPSVRDRLAAIGLGGTEEVIGRNLKALMAGRER